VGDSPARAVELIDCGRAAEVHKSARKATKNDTLNIFLDYSVYLQQQVYSLRRTDANIYHSKLRKRFPESVRTGVSLYGHIHTSAVRLAVRPDDRTDNLSVITTHESEEDFIEIPGKQHQHPTSEHARAHAVSGD
jgi:hypothetical protein